MAYPSCELFKKLLSQGKDARVSLQAALKAYLQTDISTELKTDVDWHLMQINSPDFDGNFMPLNHDGPLPKELQELLRISIIELVKSRTPSTLVADVEIKVAASHHHIKVLYEQCIRLEEALKKQMLSHHEIETIEKLKELMQEMRQKFAKLILDCKTEEALDGAMTDAFKSSSKACPLVNDLKVELESQHEFLSNKEFFEDFYAKKNLAEKFDFAYDFHEHLKQIGFRTPEIRETFIHLHYACIDAGYKPVEAKKHQLASLNETVDSVFKKLKPYSEQKWMRYKKDDLYADLVAKLAEDQENYEKWSQVRKALCKKPISDEDDLFSHAHCTKYVTQDPLMSPDEVAQSYGLTLTPKKKKQRTVIPSQGSLGVSAKKLFASQSDKPQSEKKATPPTKIEPAVSLLCTDEKLDGLDDDDEYMPLKKAHKIQ